MAVSRKERDGVGTLTSTCILYSLLVRISTLRLLLSFQSIQMPPEKSVESTRREWVYKRVSIEPVPALQQYRAQR